MDSLAASERPLDCKQAQSSFSSIERNHSKCLATIPTHTIVLLLALHPVIGSVGASSLHSRPTMNHFSYPPLLS